MRLGLGYRYHRDSYCTFWLKSITSGPAIVLEGHLMNPADFERSTCGRMVRTLTRTWAFLPDPLPPAVDLAPITPLLAEASMCLGELKGIGRKLANPYLLIRPLQHIEAVASSSIEGTYTTLSDLFLAEEGAEEPSRTSDVREVMNYVDALEMGITRLQEIGICNRLVKEMHSILMYKVDKHRGMNVVPGEFKREQNWIGGGRNVERARFVPPPPEYTEDAMRDLEIYMNNADLSRIPPLVFIAYVHYQFETIHPFPDGNGRVGRLLIPLLLVEKNILPQPLLYLSPYFEQYRDEYIDCLYNVSAEGAWLSWLEFFLQGVVDSCAHTIDIVQELQDRNLAYRSKMQQARASALVIRLVDVIFERPFLTIPRVEKILGVTYRAAKNIVDKLVDAGILKELHIPRRPKFFYAEKVYETIHKERRRETASHQTAQRVLL